jgi:hypothetical protein
MSVLKLAARLRSYDWTAAVIELVIVVVGILIALQVSNWNQGRLDNARADSYCRRIHSELMVDRQNIDNTLKFWNVVSNYGRAAIAFGESGQRMDGSNWKTVLAYYQASQLMPFELEDTVFTEMRDGGGLALIDDEGLRKRLADYYRLSGTGITANILHHDPVYRMQVRGLTPWRVQQYIWDKCYRALGGTNQELLDCPSPISDEQAAALLESYRQSESLLQNLRFWMSTLRVGAIVLDSTRKDAVSLAAEVEAARMR